MTLRPINRYNSFSFNLVKNILSNIMHKFKQILKMKKKYAQQIFPNDICNFDCIAIALNFEIGEMM